MSIIDNLLNEPFKNEIVHLFNIRSGAEHMRHGLLHLVNADTAAASYVIYGGSHALGGIRLDESHVRIL